MRLFDFKRGGVESIEERGVQVAQLGMNNDPSVELISAIGEESPVAKFIKERGGGLHHFCFEVENIHESLQILKSKGVEFVEPAPVRGAEGSSIAFVHPRQLDGVLVELKQKKT